MNGTLITTTPRGDMHPLAVQGILALDRHAQLTALLRSRLGERYALLFAEPVFDPDRGVVDWYTPANARPVHLASLDDATRDAVRERLGDMAGEIRALAENLGNETEKGHGIAGEILAAALSFPNEDALYLVGEQPVAILWGCGPATPGVEPGDLSRLARLPRRTQIPTTPGTRGEPDQTPAPVVSKERGGLLPWLAALALLLLLLALAYALWFTDEVPSLYPRMKNLNAEQERETGLQAELSDEIAALRRKVAKRKALCVKSEKKRAEQTLSLPEQPQAQPDMGFLAGTWVCDTGLADSSGVPVVVVYAFNGQGEGVVSITGATGVGPCRGKATSTLDVNGVLTIETAPSIACPGGQSFRGQSVECRRIGADTQCRGRNAGSETTWEAVFIKQ